MTTTEEVIRLMEEAGVRVIIDSKFNRDDYTSVQSSFPALVRLIELVKAEENEACAKVCEDLAGTMSMFATTRDAKTHTAAVKGDAAAIRARRNHG